MIVNCRIDVDDDTRSSLSLLLHPSKPKRLATRKEFGEFVDGCIAGLTADPAGSDPLIEAATMAETDQWHHAGNVHHRSRMDALMERARREDAKHLRGRSDGFVIGWCKVKYAKELRA